MIAWLALGLSFLGILLNAKRQVACWAVWMTSNVLWVYHTATHSDWVATILWTGFFFSNFYGWWQWTHTKVTKIVEK